MSNMDTDTEVAYMIFYIIFPETVNKRKFTTLKITELTVPISTCKPK